MSIPGFFLHKSLKLFLNSFIAISFVFILLRALPGDPVDKIVGENFSIEQKELISKELGLDRPIVLQYLSFLKGIVQGDLGRSFFKKKKVVYLLWLHMQPTFILGFSTILLSSLIGISFGFLSALYSGSKLELTLRTVSLVGISLPIFSLGPILILLFSVKLHWLPVSGWGGIRELVLPSLTMAIPLSLVLMRIVRLRYLEEINSKWVLVLLSKGYSKLQYSWRVLIATLGTPLNIIAIQLTVVLTGAIVTESIFDIPGIGKLLFEGIQMRDYALIQGIVLFMTVVYFVVFLIIDFTVYFIDPASRRGMRENI